MWNNIKFDMKRFQIFTSEPRLEMSNICKTIRLNFNKYYQYWFKSKSMELLEIKRYFSGGKNVAVKKTLYDFYSADFV